MAQRLFVFRLATINLALLFMLAIAYVFIEFGGVDASPATYAIMQLSTILIVGTLALMGGYIYVYSDEP